MQHMSQPIVSGRTPPGAELQSEIVKIPHIVLLHGEGQDPTHRRILPIESLLCRT